MRLVVPTLLAALAACGPKVQTTGSTFDEDLGKPEPTVSGDVVVEADRPVAPPGKGLRGGTIERAKLVAVLDAGPPTFLRQIEVTAKMSGERFVGWQLVQLVDRQSPLYDIDIVPGDVLLAINGQPLSRPDQLQTVWDSLRTANAVTAQLWRGEAKFSLDFTIEPAVAPGSAPAAPKRLPPAQLK